MKTYWPNGQLRESYRVALHPERDEGDTTKLKIGLYCEWHDNGQLAEQVDYNFGNCEGWHTSWYPNGQLKEKGYCFWRKQGRWFSWFDDGELAEITEYSASIKTGSSVAWFQDIPGHSRWDVRYNSGGRLHGFCSWEESPDHEAWYGLYWEGEPLMQIILRGGMPQPFFSAGKYYSEKLDLWVVWDSEWAHVSVGKEENEKRVGIWTHFMPNGDIFKEDYSKYCDE